jgi:hypothetical protein
MPNGAFGQHYANAFRFLPHSEATLPVSAVRIMI